MNKKELSSKDLNELKGKNLFSDDEVVYSENGYVIAENIKTNEKRILNCSGLMLECNKKLLKG